MKLCIGNILKILSKFKKEYVSDLDIVNEILGDAYCDLDDATVNRLKRCKRGITKNVQKVLNDYSQEEWREIAEKTLGYINPNSMKLIALSLQHLIIEDDNIQLSTVIGMDTQFKKANVERMNEFYLPEFFGNVLSYVCLECDNTEEITDFNIDYEKLKNKANEIILIDSFSDPKVFNPRRYKIDKLNPWRFNSNSTPLIGRECEYRKISKFMTCPDIPDIKWIAVVGMGGSGKSKLVYEISKSYCENWDILNIDRNFDYTYDSINREIAVYNRNLLIIIDNESVDNTPIAKWMSIQCDLKFSRCIRIIICNSTPVLSDDDNFSPWFDSVYNYDELSPSFVYNLGIDYEKQNKQLIFDNKNVILLNLLKPEELIGIAKEYLIRIHGFNSDECEAMASKAFKYLSENIDVFYLRPIFLLLICDALKSGAIDKLHNNDDLLDYAFRIERKKIRDKIDGAFGVSIQKKHELYSIIETAYANSVISSYNNDKELLLSELDRISNCVGIDKNEALKRCKNYNLCDDKGLMPIIEPSLLGEYYVMRYLTELQHYLAVKEFWSALIRDFNLLLTTKYYNGLNNIANICMMVFVDAYISGLYEAYRWTDNQEESDRIRKLIENWYPFLEQLIVDDPIIHPFGKEESLKMIEPMYRHRVENVLNKIDLMSNKGKEYVKTTSDNMYDLLCDDYARQLYLKIKKHENCVDCAVVVESWNELAKLYNNAKGRNNEVKLFVSESVKTIIFCFFCRNIEFERELTKLTVSKTMEVMKEVYESDDVWNERIAYNYATALVLLYFEDYRCLYKEKEEILKDIYKIREKYDNDNYPEIKAYFKEFDKWKDNESC